MILKKSPGGTNIPGGTFIRESRVHYLSHIFLSFQTAQSIKREGLVLKVMGSNPMRFITISSSRMHLKGANIAANIFKINNLYSFSISILKLQILYQK